MWNNVRIFKDDRQHVTKFVFTKEDAVAEAVLYRYPDYLTRTVICCSVQSGCPVGCVFCGTGNKFVRSLSLDEIVLQVRHAIDYTGERPEAIGRLQIMFMSMGEPLLNPYIYDTIEALHEEFSKADLLLSTIAPRVSFIPLMTVSRSISNVGLQFSIHASTDKERDRLIPFKNKMQLSDIANIGLQWYNITGRHPFFNYIATEFNSSLDDANRLPVLFTPQVWKVTVSVLCSLDSPVKGSTNRAISFASMLTAHGFDVRMFNPAGQDTIGGGCGQLWYTQEWIKTKN